MSLRKNRRQTISILLKDMSNERENQKELREKSRLQVLELKEVVKDMKKEVAEKDNFIRKVKEEFKDKLNDVHMKYRQLLKDEVKSVKEEHIKKLSKLEAKIEEVQNRNSELQRTEEEKQKTYIQMQIEDSRKHIHEKYDFQLQRYKEALKSLSAKAKEFERNSEESASLIQSLKNSNRQYMERIETLEESLENERKTASESNKTKEEVVLRLKTLTEKFKKLEASKDDEISSVRSITDSAINSIQSQHANELKQVDEKVRRALRSKDDIIQTLRNEIKQMHLESKEAESLIAELNHNIQSSNGTKH